MADEEEKELSPEELGQIQELLGDVEKIPDQGLFSAMTQQFQADVEELESEPEDAEQEEEYPDVLAGTEDENEQAPAEDVLPATDVAPLDETPVDPAPTDEFDLGELGDLGGSEEAPADEFDLGDLADFATPETEPAITETEPAAAEPTSVATESLDAMDEAAPEDDLLTATDITADTASDTTTDATIETSTTDEFDIADLGDFGSSEADALDAPPDDALAETPEASPPADEFDIADLGDLGGSESTTEDDLLSTPDTPAAAASTDEFDLGDLGDFGSADAAPPTEETTAEAIPGDDFDLGTSGAGDLDFSELGSLESPADSDISDTVPFSDDMGLSDEIPGQPLLDAEELDAMSEKAKLATGIGEEFSDEELANLRSQLTEYPPGIRKAVIDVVVNEKISQEDQRLLVDLIVKQSEEDVVADFIENRLGYRPDTAPPTVTKDGVPIIYAEGLSPEDMARKRRRARVVAIGAGIGLIGIMGVFSSLYILHNQSIKSLYEKGLTELSLARHVGDSEKLQKKKNAEQFFQKALRKAGGRYDTDYLNRYGISYMKAGFYEEAFIKLFGQVEKDFGQDGQGRSNPQSAWIFPGRRAPLIRLLKEKSWTETRAGTQGNITPEGVGTALREKDGIVRHVKVPGAYLIDRLRDQKLDRKTLMNLARFHSQYSRRFLQSDAGKKYKNDSLAIDYYRLILTLMNRPNDVKAMAGIGDIYYNRREFGSAARQYNKIIDRDPKDILGHAGLINTYIEIWAAQEKEDPRFIIERHRLVQKLRIEDDLPIYVMAKLAGFYIDLDEDDVRIRFQVDPKDHLTGLEIKDNAIRLLEKMFYKEEKRDEEVIQGKTYAEGFYQRGRFLLSRGESARAVKQFQNAHQYDPRHYLAVNAIGEYYKKQLNFPRAREYFETAYELYERYHKNYGLRPEDETLIKGDAGKVLYNLGSLLFLRNSGVQSAASGGFPETRIYPHRAQNPTDKQKQRIALLNQAAKDLSRALPILKDNRAKIESIYWIGWVDYLNGNFSEALKLWSRMDTLYHANYSDPSLLLARGNAYYYTKQLRSAMGHYRKALDDYERKVMILGRPNSGDSKHVHAHMALAALHNNIGAIYEREFLQQMTRGAGSQRLRTLEEKAVLNYQRAINAARQVDRDNEIARANLRLAFSSLRLASQNGLKPSDTARIPLIDDWANPILENLHKKRP